MDASLSRNPWLRKIETSGTACRSGAAEPDRLVLQQEIEGALAHYGAMTAEARNLHRVAQCRNKVGGPGVLNPASMTISLA